MLLRGYAHDPITDVRIAACTFAGVAQADVIEATRNLVLKNVTRNGKILNETLTR
jgi:hypothetical protein